jgi:DNA-binding NarL/FixJ family response regulator
MSKLRILLADDHKFLLQACEKTLAPDFDIPRDFADGHVLLKAAPTLKHDVIVLDIGMPLLNGLDPGRELEKLMPGVKLIFLTMHIRHADFHDAKTPKSKVARIFRHLYSIDSTVCARSSVG